MSPIDLHTHSTASDGSLTPSELIHAAKNAGLVAVALTDHDTINGLPEAAAAAKLSGIRLIPGIELSADYNGTDVHIVGLNLDIDSTRLKNDLLALQKLRKQRNEKMIKIMQNAGVDISIEKLEADNAGVITRANFAKRLVKTGYCKDIKEVFSKYLSPGMPFFISKEKVTPKRAIAIIENAGGVPVLAHPTLYHFSLKELAACIMELKSYGLKGIETYYSTFTSEDERQMRKLALKFSLFESGGSDFHGTVKPDIAIGKGFGNLFIPEDVLTKMGL